MAVATAVQSVCETTFTLREFVAEGGERLRMEVVVGGAVLTEEYAKRIGADKYSPDAMAIVKFATEVYHKN